MLVRLYGLHVILAPYAAAHHLSMRQVKPLQGNAMAILDIPAEDSMEAIDRLLDDGRKLVIEHGDVPGGRYSAKAIAAIEAAPLFTQALCDATVSNIWVQVGTNVVEALIWTDNLPGLLRLHGRLTSDKVTLMLAGDTADAAAKIMAGKG